MTLKFFELDLIAVQITYIIKFLRSGQNRRNSQAKIKVEQSPYEKRMGERKAEFIKKALMVNTTGLQERIKVK